MFNPFLIAYETDTMLFGDLFKRSENIISVIIRSVQINNCEITLKLKEIDLYKSVNHVSVKEIDIGFLAFAYIQKLR